MPCALWHGPPLPKQACALLMQWVVGAEEEKAEEGKRRLQQMSRGGIPLSYLPAILCFSDIISYLGSGERTPMPGPQLTSLHAALPGTTGKPAGPTCSAACRSGGVHTSSKALQGWALGWSLALPGAQWPQRVSLARGPELRHRLTAPVCGWQA